MTSYQTCIDRVKEIRTNWYSKNQAGDPIIGDLIAKRSLGNDLDYDYFPTDIDLIDNLVKNDFPEWVILCQEEEKYGDLYYEWSTSAFPRLIVYATLLLEGRQGIRINDQAELDRNVNRLISGDIEWIDLLAEEDPFGLWGDLARIVYICWLPIAGRYMFNEDILIDLEILILRIALQVSNHIGKNGRTRLDEANRTRGVAHSKKYKASKKTKIINEYGKCLSQGIEPRSKRVRITAKECGVGVQQIRKVLRENKIDPIIGKNPKIQKK